MAEDNNNSLPTDSELEGMLVSAETSALIRNLPDFSKLEPYQLALEIADSGEAVHKLLGLLTELVAQTDKSAPTDETTRDTYILTVEEVCLGLPGALAHWLAAKLALAVRRGLLG